MNSVGWIALDRWGQQVFAILAFLVISRMTGPETLGAMGLCTVVIFFLASFIVEGIGDALVQRSEIDFNHKNATFWALLGLGVVTAAVGMASAGAIARFFDEPSIEAPIQVLSATLIPLGVSSFFESVLRRDHRFRVLAMRTLLAYGASMVVASVMAVMGYGIWSYVANTVIMRLIEIVVLGGATRFVPSIRFSLPHLSDLWGFGGASIGWRLVTFLDIQAERITIGYFFGPVSLGFYSMARKIVDCVDLAVSGVMSSFALPSFSRVQNDPRRMQELYNDLTLLSALVSCPSAAGLAMVIGDIIHVALPPAWGPTIHLTQILAAQIAFNSQLTVVIGLVRGSGMSKQAFLFTTGAVMFKFVALLAAVPWGMTAVAVSSVAATAIAVPFTLIFVIRNFSFKASRFLWSCAGPIIAAVCMVVVVRYVRHIVPNGTYLTELALSISSGVGFYFLLVMLVFRQQLMRLSRLRGA